MKTLLIRADGSDRIGAGHIMRCLALAQAAQGSGVTCLFACSTLSAPLEQRLRGENIVVLPVESAAGTEQDGRETLSIAAMYGATAIVVDLYGIDESYLRTLGSDGRHIVAIDDNALLADYPVDFILNQNAHAETGVYEGSRQNAELLLGPGYALLRNEFRIYLDWSRDASRAPASVLVTLGGGNQIAALIRLIERIASAVRHLQLSIVLADEYPEVDLLRQTLQRERLSCRIIVSPSDMAAELATHDLLISSGGSTVWEALFMQIPAVFFVLAENQRKSCQALQRTVPHPVCLSLDDVSPDLMSQLITDASRREMLAKAGRSLVDGHGAGRVIDRVFKN